ncbi:phage tail protein [Burkholderia contaminans]|uniref:Oxidoreductase n=1 Tax=Burkholderia contaminans TaxID=488447 RepID=A0A3N8PEU8_9BURK|nr:phage tail protein [Burkholderia contaminans]RQT09835.1 oxidoreductase [Burkholderia contaminans]
MLVSYGQFVFSTEIAPFHQFQRQRTWKHASNSRVGARDSTQYVGQGEDTIRIEGMIATGEIGTPLSLDILESMADVGDAHVLVDGTGRIYGAFTLEELNETHSYFNVLGVALKIEFELTLKVANSNALGAAVDGGSQNEKAAPANGKVDNAPMSEAPPYIKTGKAKRAKKGK